MSRLGWRRALLLFGIVTFVHALSPGVQVTDSRMSVPTAYAALHGDGFDLTSVPSTPHALADTDYDVVRHEGATLPFFPWPPMLLAAPGVLAADLAGIDVAAMKPSAPNQTYPIELPTAALLVAAATLVTAKVALELRPDDTRFATGVALVFAFATAAWSTASRSLWQHTPATLCAAVALLAALRSRRDPRWLWALGAALAVGFTMRPTAAVPLVVLGAWSVVEHRLAAWRVVAAGAAVAVPFVLVNLAVYDVVLPPYYAGSRLGTEAAIGFGESLLVHLVSPSRGLFVYTPLFLLVPVSLWLRRRALDSLDVAVAVTVVLHALVVAGYGSTGGSSYGSRFFTEAVPYLLWLCLPLLAAARLRELPRAGVAAVGALVVASVVVTAPGALARAGFCWSATPEFVDTHPQRLWDWGDPQFLRPARRLAAGDSVRAVVVGACGDR